jgi:mannose-6-phosphate isomerase-like protein (cupin superfamily)
MQYVRSVDFSAFPAAAFHSQRLADASTGLDSCICLSTRVPPGKGTTSGLHVHPSDQLYYVLTGTMHARVAERSYVVGPGNLVVIPAGAPHWNWNEGTEDELHFELIVPQPPAGTPLVTQVTDNASTASGAASRPGFEVVRRLDESRFDPEKFSQVVLADRSSGLSTVSLGVFRVPAGAQGPELHMHRFEQIYYMISGTMELELGFERYTVGPHTLVTIPAGMPHRNWNASSTDPEYHLNLRVPEPATGDNAWDVPVTLGAAWGPA